MVSLKIAVKDNKLIKVRDTLMIEDSINNIKCIFEFRSDWDNIIKKVVFARGHIFPATQNPETVSVSLDENNECMVPPEIISENGQFSIGLFGENEDGRVVTNWLYYKTQWGCYEVGLNPNPPTPSVYDKVLMELNNKSDINHTHSEYITREESDTFIEESVSQAIDEILVSSFDAGKIIERS